MIASLLSYFLPLPQKGAKTHVFEPGCGQERARKSNRPLPGQRALRGFSSSPRWKVIYKKERLEL